MNLEEFREYCLSKPNTIEDFPFDETTLVFKTNDKIFAITGIDNIDLTVNLKCDPDYAIELRERYESIIPGYHMNKKHWNTVTVSSEISDDLFKMLIDHSFDLIVKAFPKKIQNPIYKDYLLSK